MAKSPPERARESSAAVGLRASERGRGRKSGRQSEGGMKLGPMAGGGGQEAGERRAKAPSSDPRQGLRGHASRGGQTSLCEEAVKEIGRRAAVLRWG